MVRPNGGEERETEGPVGHWEDWLLLQGKWGVMVSREVTNSYRMTPATVWTTDCGGARTDRETSGTCSPIDGSG